MRIGIDISQFAYPGTGVAAFLENLLDELLKKDAYNEYILFYSSLRKEFKISQPGADGPLAQIFKHPNVTIKTFKFPPTFLDLLWNKLHILPIEWFIGSIDIFISSDWTQPPSRAKKMTILYDLIVYKYPQETAKKIINVQKRKLNWVKKEVDKIICISQATKKDAMEILDIAEEKLEVVYPGL